MYKNYWMRNQSPEDGSSQVPWHLHAEWHEVSELVREASEELDKADSLYRETVLARISFGVATHESASWDAIREARNQAQKRLIQASEAWMHFVDKVNGRA